MILDIERNDMKDMSVRDAEAIIASMGNELTLDQLEDFSFLVLKAVSVLRREEQEQT